MMPRLFLVWHFAAILLLLWAASALRAKPPNRDVPVVGRLITSSLHDPLTCVQDEQIILRYEVVYARPSSDLPDAIDVSCSCKLIRDSGRAARPKSRPVFAAGELHDLLLHAREDQETGKGVVATAIELRRKPVATRISDVKGYDRERVARLLEPKLRDFPCDSRGSESSFPIRLQVDATGCVSSVAIESKGQEGLVSCTERNMKKWDFGYPSVSEANGRREGELSFVFVYPR